MKTTQDFNKMTVIILGLDINILKKSYQILKKTKINNYCPNCHSRQGLTLSFIQVKLISTWFVISKRHVHHRVECENCKTKIYPGQWTPDIERVIDYYQKLVGTKHTSLRFTSVFYICITIVCVLTIMGGLYFKELS